MYTLGINAYHGDSAACVLRDGVLVAAAEEERFRRVKHWAGFPSEAIGWCLAEAGARPEEIDHVAVSRDPSAQLLDKALFAFARRPSLAAIRDRLRNAGRVGDVRGELARALGVEPGALRARFHRVEHHVAHGASSFLCSPFERAALLSVDGFGDFASTMTGVGEGSGIRVLERTLFPHSLGLFYTAVTQLLGFHKYGDEYKVMALASFAEPEALEAMRTVVRLRPEGRFELDLDCFCHHSDGVAMTWEGGEPALGRVFSPELERRLGVAREPGEPIEDRHRAIAASMQAMYEEAFFHILHPLAARTGERALCLAGGCALNSVANGKVLERTPFTDVWIQPAAGDAGTAVGAALYVEHAVLGRPRGFVMRHAYWGPRFEAAAIERALAVREIRVGAAAPVAVGARAGAVEGPGAGGGGSESAPDGISCERLPEEALIERVAERIAAGDVVGWFQGRMEWGPRALGNRSILADPRRKDMQAILNGRIKHREPFRPFAPAVLLERVGDWFEQSYPDPFMLKVYKIRPERRAAIPAVTHVDGTGRLQTVARDENPLYYDLIAAFERRTGVPVLLNTSFNENEPIVCTPEEAIDCFLRTKMDALAIGPFLCAKG